LFICFSRVSFEFQRGGGGGGVVLLLFDGRTRGFNHSACDRVRASEHDEDDYLGWVVGEGGGSRHNHPLLHDVVPAEIECVEFCTSSTSTARVHILFCTVYGDK